MKAKKAVKRLAKIKALMADVTKRYSASAPHLREVLQYAEAAVTKAKEAVGLHATTRAKAGKAARPAKKARPVEKKATVKTVAMKSRVANSSRKSSPIKSARKKRPAQSTPPAPAVQAAIS
jgi:hypothetical protein